MANADIDKKTVFATVTDDAGKDITLTVDQVLQSFDQGKEALGNGYTMLESYGGFAEIELHPQKNVMSDDGAIMVLVEGFTNSKLQPGRYYILYNMANEELEQYKDDALLLATGDDQLEGDGIEAVPVTISPRDETGAIPDDPPYEPLELWLIQNTATGDYMTFKDLLNSILIQAMTSATLERLQKQGDVTITTDEGDAEPNPTLHIQTKNVKDVDFTTDKMNRKTWDIWRKVDPGQLALNFNEDDGSGALGIDLANSSDKKQKVQRIMTYSIMFDDYEELVKAGIAPKLTGYDKRVYEALATLWNHANDDGQAVYTLKDVAIAMGYKYEPGSDIKKKINDSVTKMTKARISVDNYSEAKAYRRYPRFKYDGSALPMERIAGYVDGQLTGSLIHLFREPPLFSFARGRKQVTSCDVKVLQTPINKTDTNIAIEDYLREQIAWMKNDETRNRAIRKDTLLKETGITRNKARAMTTANKVLKHYVSCNWIKGYTETGDGFKIAL